MTQILWLALAGALGTISRYYISGWSYALFGSRFPYGTLVVNIIGSFLITFIMDLSLQAMVSGTLRIAITIGFLGAFTTFSTFSYETVNLLERGNWIEALINIFLNFALSLFAAYLGLIAAKTLTRGIS